MKTFLIAVNLIAFLVCAQAASWAQSAHELEAADLVNQARIAAGVAPLRWNQHLYDSAKFHSDEMAAHNGNCPVHDSCDGTAWDRRITRYYPNWIYLGENYATTIDDPKTLVDGWLASPEHKANLLSPFFHEQGMAISTSLGAFGVLAYCTNDFAWDGSHDPTPTPGGSPTPIPTPTPVPTPTPFTNIEQLKITYQKTKSIVTGYVNLPNLTTDPVRIDSTVITGVKILGKGLIAPGFRLTLAKAPHYHFRFEVLGIVALPITMTISGHEFL